MTSYRKFCAQFKFDPSKHLMVGVEREAFLVRNGKIAPIAQEVLVELPDRNRYGYELSACQLESRVGPVHISDLKEALLTNEREIKAVEKKLHFRRSHMEVAPRSMPLDVYPDPTGRYAEITSNMPQPTLLAACRVVGTHVHVGMPNHDIALEIYNMVVGDCAELCVMGDGSDGKRLRIYKKMAPDYRPVTYKNWEHFYHESVEKGFVDDPRRCWHLIRISKHGTLEFRMFGATSSINRIVGWAEHCHKLCDHTYGCRRDLNCFG